MVENLDEKINILIKEASEEINLDSENFEGEVADFEIKGEQFVVVPVKVIEMKDNLYRKMIEILFKRVESV
jgi:hypothetical protein